MSNKEVKMNNKEEVEVMANEEKQEVNNEEVRKIIFEAPFEKLINIMDEIAEMFGIKLEWKELKDRIAITIEYNRAYKELQKSVNDYKKYFGKLKTQGRKHAIKIQYYKDRIEHIDDGSVDSLNYDDYFVKHHSIAIVKQYPVYFEEDRCFVAYEAMQKILYGKTDELKEPMVANPFEDFHVTVDEKEVLEEFGETNLRHFLWSVFEGRNCEDLPVWVGLVAGRYCGKPNKQKKGASNNVLYESTYQAVSDIKDQTKELLKEMEDLKKDAQELRNMNEELRIETERLKQKWEECRRM